MRTFQRDWHTKVASSILGLLALACAFFLMGCAVFANKPGAVDRSVLVDRRTPRERAKEQRGASHLVEAVMASGDMTFKMPVLETALRDDDPHWELLMQQLINREQWPFAKVHFIHLYWRRVLKKDEAFMARMLDYLRVYRLCDDSLGIVEEMLKAETISERIEYAGPNGGPVPFGVAGEEEDICEAVFRWQFDNILPRQRQRAQVYFLQVGSSPVASYPSDEFMERFAGQNPAVRPVSSCEAGREEAVRDKNTGELGLIFRVTHFLWKSQTEVDVKGGCYESLQRASKNTYTLKKAGGKWGVTNVKVEWITQSE